MLSVNDVIGGYRMAGIPDGLGAFDNGNGTFTLLVNHEIGNTLGVVRAHGSKGAFVSKWIINKSDLKVQSGSDLMQQLYLWNPSTSSYALGTTAFSRFCSADLPPVSAFYNAASGLGTQERIFMDGEESGVEGRAVGHIVTGAAGGVSYELPALGKFSWENSVASGATGDKTVVGGMDDGTGGQVYFYIGTKTNSGTDIEKAGLSNGKLFGVKVSGYPLESSASLVAAGTHFDLFDLGQVQNTTGAAIEAASVAGGVTTFLRPEDGAWDPAHPNDFYFATTNAFNAPTRLWRLRFDNVLTPEAGGTITAVLDGTEGAQMLDNITVDKKGNILLVEDVGNNAHIGRVWQYSIAGDSLTKIGYHDSSRFLLGGANFLTQDEEASGILDVSEILGPGMFLVDVQAHYAPAANTAEVVEGGQLLAFYDPLSFGKSTAPDTLRVNFKTGTVPVVNLGIPSAGDNGTIVSLTNNAPATFSADTTIVVWTATDASGNMGFVNQVVILKEVLNQKPAIAIINPVAGGTYDAGTDISFSVTASDPDGTVAKVDFYANGTSLGSDVTPPFELIASQVPSGTYLIYAVAKDNDGDSTISDSLSVAVTGCIGSGSIIGEGYTNIAGATVADLTSNIAYPNNPSVTAQLYSFEYGPNIGDNYGARVRGYVCAPESGYYTFYIAADDQAGLYLSTNDQEINKILIAYTERGTTFRNWYAFSTQKSQPVFLVKGVRSYIETLHKEANGPDHLSVAWKIPGGLFEGPIAGSRLSPISTAVNPLSTGALGKEGFAAEMAAADTYDKGLEVKVRPNPSANQFTLNLRSSKQGSASLLISDATGRIVDRKSNVNANGSITIGSSLKPGIYFVEITQGEDKVRLKLIKQ